MIHAHIYILQVSSIEKNFCPTLYLIIAYFPPDHKSIHSCVHGLGLSLQGVISYYWY